MAARPCITFPLPPLKFRTAGFPRYGFKPAPAPATFTSARAAGLYAVLVRLDVRADRLPLCGGRRTSPRTCRSRGPWLAGGLFCPARSSLTMASSEPLGLSRSLLSISAGSLPFTAKTQRVPNLLRLSFFPCRLPCPAGPTVFDCSTSADGSLRLVSMGSAPASPTQKSVHAWNIFRAAKFA